MDNGELRYGAMGSALRSPLPTPIRPTLEMEKNRAHQHPEYTTFALAEIFG
jgi:hypothetical protein